MTVPCVVRLVKGTPFVKIHFFVHSEKGPIRTAPNAELILQGVQNKIAIPAPMQGGASGFIACQPMRKSLGGQMHGGRAELCPCSDEVRAVTCQECQATEAFKKAAEELAAMLAETIP